MFRNLPRCRPWTVAILCTYLALSLTQHLSTTSQDVLEPLYYSLDVAVIGWLFLWWIFKRPAYVHGLLLPVFLILPLELYLRLHFNTGLKPHHFGILAETNPTEALEFVGDQGWLWALIWCVVLLWWFLILRAMRQTRALDCSGRLRFVVALIVLVGASVLFYSDRLNSETIEKTRPFGLVASAYQFWQERINADELMRRKGEFAFHAQSATQDKRVIVLVIGESARADRWSLNGYARETNPLLAATDNLINLTNVVSATSATSLSVPVMLSRLPAVDSFKSSSFNEKSIVSAFNESGFHSYWLSNQLSFGKYDTTVTAIAKEAKHLKFLNIAQATHRSSFDEVLLDPFKKILSENAEQKFIVLHTLGSHWNYSYRHPQSFDRWQPSLYGTGQLSARVALKERLNNSYDNSILYTDWMLSNIIEILKSSAEVSAMIYISDHGQNLYDGACTLVFHGRNTQYDFQVPALVWYSEQFAQRYPEKIVSLRKHREAPLSVQNIFHSLADLGDIQIPGDTLSGSFFNEKFSPQKRYVDSYGMSDYDNSSFDNTCREVIDKGTPLPRN